MKTPRRFILTLMVWVALISTASSADVYPGKVVDAVTGEPLVGAVVTVIWYRSAIVSMDRARTFHSAQETLTDIEGKFFLEVSAGVDWHPLFYVVKEPDIVIYQPGYGPLSPKWLREFTGRSDLVESLKKDAVVKLPKLKTKEELTKFTVLFQWELGKYR